MNKEGRFISKEECDFGFENCRDNDDMENIGNYYTSMKEIYRRELASLNCTIRNKQQRINALQKKLEGEGSTKDMLYQAFLNVVSTLSPRHNIEKALATYSIGIYLGAMWILFVEFIRGRLSLFALTFNNVGFGLICGTLIYYALLEKRRLDRKFGMRLGRALRV